MMAQAVPGGDRDVSLGRVFARTFATIGARPVAILAVALVFGALPRLLWGLASARALRFDGGVDFTALMIASQGGSLLVKLVTGTIVQGAVTWIVVAHSAKDRTSVVGTLAVIGRTLLPLLALAIVTASVIVAGLIAAIVPGVLAWVLWSVAAPVLVAERRGVLAAMGRSAALTRGARWQVLGLELAVLVFALMIGGVIGVGGVILGVRTAGGFDLATAAIAVSSLASTLASALNATIQASLYVELRDWKDGPPGDRLAAIFA